MTFFSAAFISQVGSIPEVGVTPEWVQMSGKHVFIICKALGSTPSTGDWVRKKTEWREKSIGFTVQNDLDLNPRLLLSSGLSFLFAKWKQ